DVRSGRHQVTLKESFAQSINIVFGKLGAVTLGPETLEEFARRFYFNQPIHFEMPVEPSRFSLPDEDYFRLAEIASGFNRTTMLSPLHGAMLAAAIVNNGLIMEPTIVREVFDQDNNIYYSHQPVLMKRVISSQTVREMRKMMQATITKGTAHQSFKDVNYHPVLSRLEIGGKSGSINDDLDRKVDWFVSFARRKGTTDRIALAVLVVHYRDKLGVRAYALVRDCMIQYFSPRIRPDKKFKTKRG
ncbi:MAG: PbpA, partial [Deltaproteobacteria bacterium]|nr:PbpA [Deltaproteobacteria bacterium]